MHTATTIEYTMFPSLGVYRPEEEAHPVPSLSTSSHADTTTYEYRDEFAQHFAKLDLVAVAPDLWPEQTERPLDNAIAWARYVLQQFEEDKLNPTRVVASAEGGIAICFVRGNKYADIECLNNGVILGVTSNRRDRPVVWEISPDAGEIARASARIRLFFGAPPTSQNAAWWAWRR